MADFGIQTFGPDGSLWWDSTTAVGGVPVGFFAGATHAGTLSFPDYAGRTMQVLQISGTSEWSDVGPGVSISHASGFPVVTVDPAAQTFMLVVF